MSQLDVLLLELKRAIDEKRADENGKIAEEAQPEQPESIDPAHSKRALRKFITSADYTVRPQETAVLQNPRVIEAMRMSLNNFIREPLHNDGSASASGIICQEATEMHAETQKSSSHQQDGPGEIAPFTPPQGSEFSWAPPCAKCAERTQESTAPNSGQSSLTTSQAAASARSGGAAEAVAQGMTSGYSSMPPSSRPPSPSNSQSSSSSNGTVNAVSNGAGFGTQSEAARGSVAQRREAAMATSSTPVAPPEQPKSAVQALLNVFGSRGKSQNRPSTEEPVRRKPNPSDVERTIVGGTSTATLEATIPVTEHGPSPETRPDDSVAPSNLKVQAAPVQAMNNNSVIWFKHFQSVEAAIQMSDVHFASVLLALLVEVADAVSAPPNIVARLKSFEARIAMELKNFEQAEKTLKQAIDELGSTHAGNIAAAYCWYALAVCHHRQGKAGPAKDAQQQSIQIATSALGPKDPETLQFHEPLT